MPESKVMKLETITRILKEHKEELKDKYGVTEMGVFGSYVRGEQKEESDLDILVEFKPDSEIGLLDFVGLENDLSNILGVKVDLVEKSVLKPRIGRHILGEVVLV